MSLSTTGDPPVLMENRDIIVASFDPFGKCDRVIKNLDGFRITLDDKEKLYVRLKFVKYLSLNEVNPEEWFKRPLLFVIFVGTLDSHEYREKLSEMSSMSQALDRDGKEWLILHTIDHPDAKKESFFYRGVFDKMKSDFNQRQCLQVVKGGERESPDLEKKIRDSLIQSMEKVRSTLQLKITKMKEANPNESNFCSRFIVQEDLALIYRQFGQLNLAAKIYHDLEKEYLILGEKTMKIIGKKDLELFESENGKTIVTKGLDIPINQWCSEKYRATIAEKNISVEKGALKQAAKIAMNFLQDMSRKVNKVEESFPQGFADIFGFTASLNIVNILEIHGQSELACKGLGFTLHYSRQRLDRILDSQLLWDNLRRSGILSNPVLLDVIEKNRGEEQWMSLTNKAIQHFESCSLYRFASQLKFERAMFLSKSGHFLEAEKSALLALERLSCWSSLFISSKKLMAECQKRKNVPLLYARTCLDLITPFPYHRNIFKDLIPDNFISESEREVYQTELMAALEQVKTEEIFDIQSLLSCKVSSESKTYFIGHSIDVTFLIHSLFPLDFTFHRGTINFSKSDSSSMISFDIDRDIQIISNQLTKLVYPTSFKQKGRFQFIGIDLFFKKSCLRFRAASESAASKFYLTIEPTPTNTQLNVIQPTCLLLGETQAVRFSLLLQNSDLQSGSLSAKSTSGLLFPDCSEGCLLIGFGDEKREMACSFQRATVHLPPCPSGSQIDVFFPVFAQLGTQKVHQMEVSLVFEKTTGEKVAIEKLFSLVFTKALNLRHSVSPNSNGVFLQVALENVSGVPLQVSNHSFTCSGDFEVQGLLPVDVSLTKIPCGSSLSLVYPLVFNNSHSSPATYSRDQLPLEGRKVQNGENEEDSFKIEGDLNVLFSLDGLGDVALNGPSHLTFLSPQYHFIQKILSIQPKVEFEMSLQYGSTATIGKKFCFSFSLTKQRRNSIYSSVFYNIDVDPSNWLIIGKCRGLLEFSPDSMMTTISFFLVGLTAGSLPIPAISFTQLNPKQIKRSLSDHTIHVYPSPSFSSPTLRIRQEESDFWSDIPSTEMAFLTPSGRPSDYKYQYHHGKERGSRIIKGDIVQIYEEMNTIGQQPVFYSVLYGNGTDKLNPGLELVDLSTGKEHKRARAKDLVVVCFINATHCDCIHHRQFRTFLRTGDFGANLQRTHPDRVLDLMEQLANFSIE